MFAHTRNWLQALPARVRLIVSGTAVMYVDAPRCGPLPRGDTTIAGWAFSANSEIVKVEALIDDQVIGRMQTHVHRADVHAKFPNRHARRSGFSGVVQLPGEAFAPAVLVVRATDERGAVLEARGRLRRGGEAHAAHLVLDEWEVTTSSGVSVQRDSSSRVTLDPTGRVRQELEEILALARDAVGREPSVLDWTRDAIFAGAMPGRAVFPPPNARLPLLPHLDRSVDIVVCPDESPQLLAEARRVAALAVYKAVRVYATGGPGYRLVCEHRHEIATPASPTISVIVHVRDMTGETERFLAGALGSLPVPFGGDLLIVDDSPDGLRAEALREAAGDLPITVLRFRERFGYAASCNRAAESATGELLVFIHPSVVPKRGFLPPITRLFHDFPEAGAVGPKLVDPRGCLLHAGGMRHENGRMHVLGYGEIDHGIAHHNYVRIVDSCSAALLATPRSLFMAVGGFDTAAGDVVLSDMGYAARLRSVGRHIYYQPETVAVCAGPPPPLRSSFASDVDAMCRGGVRRALVWSPVMPNWDEEGGGRRLLHIVQMLQGQGYAVTFMADNATGCERHARALRQMGVATYSGQKTVSRDECLFTPERLVEDGRFDLCVLAFWHHAERYLPLLRKSSPATRIMVDSIDLHFLREARKTYLASSNGTSGLDHEHADRLIRELNTYSRADAVVTVSRKEAALINDFLGHERAHCVPDIEEAHEFAASASHFAEHRGMVFIGNYLHDPNVDAVDFLCQDILPRVDAKLREEHPVYIVGHAAHRLRRYENVRMVGWVPSVLPYLRQARVALSPLRFGAGTKRKLMQALLVGTPSVSTSIGVEGLSLTDGEDVLRADDAGAFAAAIERLLRDEALWSRLARSGRERIVHEHTFEYASQCLAAALGRLPTS